MNAHLIEVQIINRYWAGGPFSTRPGWDRVVATASCDHCGGTGLAPSADARTECGFCASS